MAYELRFTFFSIYGPILYHFRDKARYWSKIATFHAAPALDASVIGVSVIAITFGKKKLDWLGYETVRNV